MTLADPATHDWSMIVCTESNVTFHLQVADGLKYGAIHVWKSDAQEQFQKLADVNLTNGDAVIPLAGDAVYTFTTTIGQHKGVHPAPPEAKPFPLPYSENFEAYAAGKTPRYFSDQKGTFETAVRPDGKGICLKQILPAQGILWLRDYRTPYTLIGDNKWNDYSLQADVLVTNGSVEVGGRFGDVDVLGYSLTLKNSGEWALIYHGKESETVNGRKTKKTIADTLAGGVVTNFNSASWHTLRISFAGETIIGAIDGWQVAEAADKRNPSGMAYLASSYDPNCFDNVKISH